MKKSLLTIITFALVLVNLVLTAVMALTIVPEVNNVNSLIARINSAIDLDIQSGNEHSGGSSYSMDSVAPHSLTDNLTINLKKGDDGEQHFAVLGITILSNTSSDAYENYQDLTEYDNVIAAQVNSIVSGYTLEQMQNNSQEIRDEIRASLNTMFGSDLIASVEFSTATYQ